MAVNETLAPLTFFDADGNFRGITADLLEVVRLRTGLRFEIQRERSLSTMMHMVQQHDTDIISAISPSASRESALAFSRPYLENSFVLLSRKGAEQPTSLDQLAGKRLALTHGNPLTDYLVAEYPQITLVETDDIYQATELLAEGKADGAVNTLVIANYLLASQLFQDRLQISTTLGTQPAMFSLATARDATELGSILNKHWPRRVGRNQQPLARLCAGVRQLLAQLPSPDLSDHYWHQPAAVAVIGLECVHAPPDQSAKKSRARAQRPV